MKSFSYLSPYLSHSEAETEQLGQRLAASLDRSSGVVIAFQGGLGAGKTAFIRGLAKGLGYTGRVTSPTFSIVQEYESNPPLFHFDWYRLQDIEDLFDIGWDDYLNRNGICAVEWSEQIAEALPDDTIMISINRVPEHLDWRKILIFSKNNPENKSKGGESL